MTVVGFSVIIQQAKSSAAVSVEYPNINHNVSYISRYNIYIYIIYIYINIYIYIMTTDHRSEISKFNLLSIIIKIPVPARIRT